MEQVKERLAKYVITSVHPKATLEAVESAIAMIEAGDERKQGYRSVKDLLALGILRRGATPEEMKLAVSKEELSEVIRELRDLLAQNVVLAENLGGKAALPGHYNEIILQAWYLRDGWNMVSMPKISASNIQTKVATFYVVPRARINDLLLRIYVERHWDRRDGHYCSFLRFEWMTPHFAYETIMEGKRVHTSEGKEQPADVGELLNYKFDRKVKLSREMLKELSEFSSGDVVRLRDVLFELEEDVGEHSEVVDSIVSVGRMLGYRAEKEVDIGGNRIDAVWYKEGKPAYSFEVVLEGSLEEAIFKLGRFEGVRCLVFRESDRGRLEKRAVELGFKGLVFEAEKLIVASQACSQLEEIAKLMFGSSQKSC